MQNVKLCQTIDSNNVIVGCLVRLAGEYGRRDTAGRLEVLYKGIWGTVCSHSFNDAEARVFCNQLGYG